MAENRHDDHLQIWTEIVRITPRKTLEELVSALERNDEHIIQGNFWERQEGEDDRIVYGYCPLGYILANGQTAPSISGSEHEEAMNRRCQDLGCHLERIFSTRQAAHRWFEWFDFKGRAFVCKQLALHIRHLLALQEEDHEE